MGSVGYSCVMGGSAELLTNLGLIEAGASAQGGAGSGGDGGGGRGEGGVVGGSCGDLALTGGRGAFVSFGRMKICGDAFDTTFLPGSSFSIIRLSCSWYSLTRL